MFPNLNPEYFYQGNFIMEQMTAVKNGRDIEFDIYPILGFKGKKEYIKAFFGVLNQYWRNEYDVIHVHYGLAGLFLLAPLLDASEKTVVTLHGGDILPDQKKRIQVQLVRRICKRAKHVIVVSSEMCKYVQADRVDVIPCGVDLNFFRPPSGSILPSRTLYIAFGAKPERWVKGYSLFASVIEQLRIQNLSVEPIVIDDLNKNEVREALWKSDCLLVTSYSEGSPQIVKESLACGTPIVSVDVGDVKEIVELTGGGSVVNDRSSKKLAMNVIEVIKSEKLQAEKGNWHSILKENGYGSEDVAAKIFGVYVKLSKNKNSNGRC